VLKEKMKKYLREEVCREDNPISKGEKDVMKYCTSPERIWLRLTHLPKSASQDFRYACDVK